MKLNVIRDDKGKVVATFENASSHDGASVKPVLKPGHKVVEIEVEEGYRANLASLYQKHSA